MVDSSSAHVSVLLVEVVGWLQPRPGDTIVDGTVGGGGHSRALAERVGPDGLVIALDRDPAALEAAQITGAFVPPGSADRSSALREGLDAHARLQRDLAVLRARAAKEKQINRRVELNLEIKRLEAELSAAAKTL